MMLLSECLLCAWLHQAFSGHSPPSHDLHYAQCSTTHQQMRAGVWGFTPWSLGCRQGWPGSGVGVFMLSPLPSCKGDKLGYFILHQLTWEEESLRCIL